MYYKPQLNVKNPNNVLSGVKYCDNIVSWAVWWFPLLIPRWPNDLTVWGPRKGNNPVCLPTKCVNHYTLEPVCFCCKVEHLNFGVFGAWIQPQEAIQGNPVFPTYVFVSFIFFHCFASWFIRHPRLFDVQLSGEHKPVIPVTFDFVHLICHYTVG